MGRVRRLVVYACAGLLAIALSAPATGAPVQRETHHVTMEGGPLFYMWTFEPSEIEIARRDRVVWTNETDTTHHVTFYDGPFEKTLHAGSGEKARQRFRKRGVYLYRCDLPNHSELIGDECFGMCGSVTVD